MGMHRSGEAGRKRREGGRGRRTGARSARPRMRGASGGARRSAQAAPLPARLPLAEEGLWTVRPPTDANRRDKAD
ncbi:hypothetical protein GCM10017688_54810 [Streptomyces ramulosus]